MGHDATRARPRLNNVAITADVQDAEAAQAMVNSPSPETVASMQSHGVLPRVTTYIEK